LVFELAVNAGTVQKSAQKWVSLMKPHAFELQKVLAGTVFQGASSLSLDGKGRLSVPSRHREQLVALAQGLLTVTRHPDGCLVIFPRPEWERFRERIAALPMSGQWWKRIILGNAMDVELDATGRILISPELRLAAGIERETLLLGMGKHFELWDRATHAKQEAQALQGSMPEIVRDFSF
jgi:MraZ protein